MLQIPRLLVLLPMLFATAAAGPVSAQVGGASGTVVESASLGSLDFFSAAGRRTALGPELWSGASADLARSVIGGLGEHPLTPGMNQLARQLLATGARGPDGAHDDADLAGDRVLALIRLGDQEAARGVLARTPGIAAHARLSQAAAELALWSGEIPRACAVGEALSQGRDGGFWLQLRALCLATAGKTAEAQLALELAAAAPARDPAAGRLVAALVNGGPPPPASADTALGHAASRALKLDMTGAIATAPVPALVVLTADEAQSPTVRRLAALRLIRLGADAAELIRPVLLLPVPAAAPPPAEPPPPPPPLPRKGRHGVKPAVQSAQIAPPAAPSDAAQADDLARSYAAARDATDPAERNRALLTLLQPARGDSFRALAALAAPELALATPDGLAPAERMLLALAAATVDAASTGRLRDSLKRDEPGGPSAVSLSLLDAVHVVTAPRRSAGQVLDQLVDEGARAAPADAVRAQGAALILFGVSEDPGIGGLSPLARQQLVHFEPAPAHHVAAALLALDAAARNAPGEAGLATLATTSADGSGAALAPAERALFLRSLVRAGLAADARSIALDGLLALAGR